MNFGRIPYQFTTINPSSEQESLRKRFGLANPNKMILDYGLRNGAGESNSVDCSPRLQHRVPVFVKDPNMSIDKCESNSDHSRKPNVRIVPIEIEGASKVGRQRTFSEPTSTGDKSEKCNDCVIPGKHIETEAIPCRKRMPSKGSSPIVFNIPVKVLKSNDKNVPNSNSQLNHSIKDVKTVCNIPINEERPNRKSEPEFTGSFKKISNILEELKSYEKSVENYNGSGYDKEYKYLDEMLTRCMLRLDDVETLGNEEIRTARKNAIKKVQSCIDFLETKINAEKDPILSLSNVENSEKMPTDHMKESLMKCEENREKDCSEIEMKDETEESNVNCPNLKIVMNEANILLNNNENKNEDSHKVEMKDEKSEMKDRDSPEIEMKDENELSNGGSLSSKIGEENLLLINNEDKNKDGSEIEMKKENPEIETKEECPQIEMKVKTSEIDIEENTSKIEIIEKGPEIEMKDEGQASDLNCPTNKIDTDEESMLVFDHQSNTKTLPIFAISEETTKINAKKEHSMLPKETQDTVPSDSNSSIGYYTDCETRLRNNSKNDSAIKEDRIGNVTKIQVLPHALDESKNLTESSNVQNDCLPSFNSQNSELEQFDKRTCTTYDEHSSDNVNL